MTRSTIIASAGLLALLLQSASVLGESSDTETAARVHDDRAAALFAEGEYHMALVEMESAEDLLPVTQRLYNIGVCHERLGNLEQAVAYFQRFLEGDDHSGDRDQRARARIRAIQRQLEVEGDQPAASNEEGASRVSASEAPSRRRLSPAIFYALLGVTAATTAVWAITGGLTLRHLNDYDTSGQTDSDAASSAQRLGHATDALIGVSAAAAISTLIVGIFTRWGGADRGTTVSLGPSTPSRGLTLSVAGRY